MAIPVLLPKQGNTVEECIIVEWKFGKSEKVAKGDILVDIETDKATFEVEAPESGILLETFFENGDIAPVLVNIAVIGSEGESTEEFRPVIKEKVEEAVSEELDKPVISSTPPSRSTGSVEMGALEKGGSVNEGGVSPRARVTAAKFNLDPETVAGTGPNGRVIERDILKTVERGPSLSSLASNLTKDGYSAPSSGSGIGGMVLASDMKKPGKAITGMRAIIAERMMQSLNGSAQYTLNSSADARGLLAARKEIKSGKDKEGYVDINLNDMLMYGVIEVLKQYPDLNAELIDNKIYTGKDINLAFACDTERGLMVPVIKKSQELSLKELALKTRELAAKVQDGTVNPDDLSGGTFTVTNLGSLGVENFTPVLNVPQVAILGVGSIKIEPVRVDGKVEFIEKIGLSLTADHRAVDGAPAARFLKALAELLGK